MKMPNGYGSVIKLGGKRRRPYATRVTDGWEINPKTGKEKQKFKYIDYYKTRPEAMIGLAEYNKDPYDIDARKVIFSELYKMWSKEKYKIGENDEASKQLISTYSSAYKNAEPLHRLTFSDMRAHHMQDVIAGLNLGYSSKNNVRILFKQMYEFARKNDMVEKDYSEFISVPNTDKPTGRRQLTEDEIKTLWDNQNKYELIVDASLIMIYTGMRIGELLKLDKEDINLEDRFLTGGLKTEAGKNRVVPLNKKIIPIFRKRKESDDKFLFMNESGGKLSYHMFMLSWRPTMKKLKMKHTPHNCRHTFATLMNNADANSVSTKRIMGHAIDDITHGVYTHKDLEQLLRAIDLI